MTGLLRVVADAGAAQAAYTLPDAEEVGVARANGEAMFLRRLQRLRELLGLEEHAAELHEQAAHLHDEDAAAERDLGHDDVAAGMERSAVHARELQRIEQQRAETAQSDIDELTGEHEAGT